jgi:uncharacterized membrane protein YhaH (DUF805 family)
MPPLDGLPLDSVPINSPEEMPLATGSGGRLNRLRFLIRIGASLSALAAALSIDWPNNAIATGNPGALLMVVGIAVTVTAYHVLIGAKRCHDFGASGWLAIGLAIPAVNIVMFLALALIPGAATANQFGLPNRPNGLLVWAGYLLFVLIPLGLAPVAAVKYTAQQQAPTEATKNS